MVLDDGGDGLWVCETMKTAYNGGQSGSGSGTVTPGGPEEIIPIG